MNLLSLDGTDWWALFVQIIIAGGILWTLYYVRKTYLFSNESMKDERQSKRAYMAPCTEPGGINNFGGIAKKYKLNIHLENCGINPVRNFRSALLIVNKGSKKDEVILDNSDKLDYVFNPVPKNKIIEIGMYILSEDMPKVKNGTIALVSKYKDEKLNEEFEEIFGWSLGEDGKLYELDQDEHARLIECKEFMKNKFTQLERG